MASPRLSKRSVSPNPRHHIDTRKKQVSIELPTRSNENGTHVSRKVINLLQHESNDSPSSIDSANTNSENKYENISDNGSEISDEGYRSLVQVNGIKVAKNISTDHVTPEDIKHNGSFFFNFY